MGKITKKRKELLSKIDRTKLYSVQDASAVVKKIANSKFDESIDLAVRLGVDPRKANQMVRGVVSLPHGTGKDVRVLALVTPDKEVEAQEGRWLATHQPPSWRQEESQEWNSDDPRLGE